MKSAICAATSRARFRSSRRADRRRTSRRSEFRRTATTQARTHWPSSTTSRSANEGADLKQRLLLAGGGHAHLGVLHDFARAPLVDTDITLVSPFPRQVYSGMLPGWIAGHYELDECVVQLAQLAARAGARCHLAHIARIDLATR